MIPLYGSSLCVGLDRGAYCVLPAARSRSNWPVSIQWWIVLRLILNCLDSSAFVMLLLSPTAWNALHHSENQPSVQFSIVRIGKFTVVTNTREHHEAAGTSAPSGGWAVTDGGIP